MLWLSLAAFGSSSKLLLTCRKTNAKPNKSLAAIRQQAAWGVTWIAGKTGEVLPYGLQVLASAAAYRLGITATQVGLVNPPPRPCKACPPAMPSSTLQPPLPRAGADRRVLLAHLVCDAGGGAVPGRGRRRRGVSARGHRVVAHAQAVRARRRPPQAGLVAAGGRGRACAGRLDGRLHLQGARDRPPAPGGGGARGGRPRCPSCPRVEGALEEALADDPPDPMHLRVAYTPASRVWCPQAMGGRFRSLMPSDLRAPGALAFESIPAKRWAGRRRAGCASSGSRRAVGCACRAGCGTL